MTVETKRNKETKKNLTLGASCKHQKEPQFENFANFHGQKAEAPGFVPR